MGKNVSKWSQLLEGESYSVHIGSSFLFCAGLAYVADQYAARSSHMPVINLLKNRRTYVAALVRRTYMLKVCSEIEV